MKDLIYLDRDRVKQLCEKFDVEKMPTFLWLSSEAVPQFDDGVDIVRGAYNRAIREWHEEKRFTGTREAREGEYIWYGSICTNCFICPIIGSRYGCMNEKCDVDLCETCLTNYQHEHPIIEYLVPKQKYSFEQIFKSVPHLLNPNSDEKIEKKSIWENNVKSIGFYFSAHWCEPCREFTPKLAELYKELQANCQSFRIVFVSSDFDERSFNEYRSEMPWQAIPFDSLLVLDVYFRYLCKCSFYSHLFSHTYYNFLFYESYSIIVYCFV